MSSQKNQDQDQVIKLKCESCKMTIVEIPSSDIAKQFHKTFIESPPALLCYWCDRGMYKPDWYYKLNNKIQKDI